MDRFFKQEEGTIPQLRAVYDNLQTVVQQVNDSDHVDDTSQALHSWWIRQTGLHKLPTSENTGKEVV